MEWVVRSAVKALHSLVMPEFKQEAQGDCGYSRPHPPWAAIHQQLFTNILPWRQPQRPGSKSPRHLATAAYRSVIDDEVQILKPL